MRRLNIVLLVTALFAAGFAGAYWVASRQGGTHSDGRALIGGPFTLTGTDGKRVTDRDFRGRLMLVFFGYTHCPDVCPTELQTLADVLDKLGADADKVAPVFISVDPQRDTPEAVSNYVKSFSPRIEGLTGDMSEVASAAKAYRVYFRKAAESISGSEYSVDHSGFVYLMDEDGRYLTHFTFNTSPDTIIDVVKKHFLLNKNANLLSSSTKD